jgi:hypothetical protein
LITTRALAKERLGDAAATARHHDQLLADRDAPSIGGNRTGCGCHAVILLLVNEEHMDASLHQTS